MNKPVLVIMAAGMGSRFGGLKQMTPVDEYGHVIMDFALFDARRAGFQKVVFVIKEVFADDFKKKIGDRITPFFESVEYAYQDVKMVPAQFEVPEDREKPWGTAHAVLCAAQYTDGPFAVINADDYYGPEAFEKIYRFLSENTGQSGRQHFAMVAYMLKHTLTENGTVSRGVCTVDEHGYLGGIVEREKIKRLESGIGYFDEDSQEWKLLSDTTPVSMNMWGFCRSFMDTLSESFPEFLRSQTPEQLKKAEYYLPSAVWDLVTQEKADVKVLTSSDRWFGVTYKEDKQMVEDTVVQLKKDGVYPEELWRCR